MNKAELAKAFNDLKQLFMEGYENVAFHRKVVTTAGIPERLADQSIPCAQVLIKALRGNGGYIEIGSGDGESQTTIIGRGHELEEKEIVIIPINNLNKLWVDTTNSGDGVSCILVW